MPRVLILHASVGTGHQRAAAALAAAFTRKQGGEVRVEDALDYGNKLFRQTYTRSYLEMSERTPLLWGLFFSRTDTSEPEWIEITNRLRGLVEGLGVTRLERLVRTFAPDAIVCTHFLPVELLQRLKQQGRLPQPIFSVVTDFFPHSFWVTPGIDGYFVASEMTRDLLVARGVTPAIVNVSGIPIDPAISDPKPMDEMRIKHGFSPGEPLVSLFGGGLIVSEALARGAPLVVIDPIPGQEEWNADYVVSAGAGIQLRMVETVPGAVRRLLAHREWLAALRDGARAAGRPRAALDITEQILHELHVGVHA